MRRTRTKALLRATLLLLMLTLKSRAYELSYGYDILSESMLSIEVDKQNTIEGGSSTYTLVKNIHWSKDCRNNLVDSSF